MSMKAIVLTPTSPVPADWANYGTNRADKALVMRGKHC
jgi:hypothetical protein